MKVTAIRDLTVRFQDTIANSIVSFAGHDVSLVAVVSDVIRGGKPLTGLAFNSIGRFAQSGILRSRIIPRLLSADPDSLLRPGGGFDCGAIYKCAMRDEKPGGHGDRASAVAAVELAFWDLNAKLADEPAYATIARHFNRQPAASVRVYAAGGYYYPGDAAGRLRDELRGYLASGFTSAKIKIGGAPPAEDLARIETAIGVLGSGTRLAVDANGRFDEAAALATADMLRPYRLRWFEEVCDPLDFAVNRKVIEYYGGAVAGGENLFSVRDVANFVRFGGMRPGLDIFQMDPGLSYGLTEFARMIDLLAANGFSREAVYPHGGHLINLHVVCGMGLGGCEAYPKVFQPFGGYSPQCAIAGGFIRPADHPGFGLENKVELRPFIEQILG